VNWARKVILLLILTVAVFAAIEHIYSNGALDRWIRRVSAISLFGALHVH
jgi:hypothetical protein